MKQLNNFIQEKLVISKNLKKQCKYFPKDKDELKKIVDKLIKERGENADLNDIDTSEITDMSYLFDNSDFNGDISQWDVSKVKDMDAMFQHCKFNGDISKWDISNVIDMSFMFYQSEFTGKNSDLSNWDVSKVKLMNGVFWDSKFTGNIDNWNPSKDLKYNFIFKNCPLEKNPPKWYNKR